MLSEPERQALQAAATRVREQAGRSLQSASDPWQAVSLVGELHRSIDRLAAHASQQMPAPACRAGCAHCCSAPVEVATPEALRIAAHLRAQLSVEAQEAVVAQLHRRVEDEAADRGEWQRRPCVFLQEQRCSVYAVRPAVCRKAHSLSLQACEQQASDIPQSLNYLLQVETLMAGSFQAYGAQGLDASPKRLPQAVLSAMVDEASAQRWYGERSSGP